MPVNCWEIRLAWEVETPYQKNDPPNVLEVSNVCNFVAVGEEPDVASRQFKEFVSAQRIDFMYDEQNRSLSVSVKYRRVPAEDPSIASALGFVVPGRKTLNAGAGQRRIRRAAAIAIGTTFVKDGELFRVSRVFKVHYTGYCKLYLHQGRIFSLLTTRNGFLYGNQALL